MRALNAAAALVAVAILVTACAIDESTANEVLSINEVGPLVTREKEILRSCKRRELSF